MGGYFGAALKRDAISDVFFGTDYHSHLGTKCGGMASYDPEIGLQREIHNIANSPFRTKTYLSKYGKKLKVMYKRLDQSVKPFVLK